MRGSSSRQRTPWGARDTSPGVGAWPPPLHPTAEVVWCGVRRGQDAPTTSKGYASLNAQDHNDALDGYQRRPGLARKACAKNLAQ
jgi:hypothetical protein